MKGPRMLQRPLLGGVFGQGQFALASLPCVANGLHAVRFSVIEPRAGAVLSTGLDKREAIEAARRLLRGPAANDLQWQQRALWTDLPMPADVPKVRDISRRRREVFARSEGRCHYCRTTLTLDGRWHVEHMVPRALDGRDGGHNLVAACAPCNLRKRDRTALEFIADDPAAMA
jgi:hypothetical protein